MNVHAFARKLRNARIRVWEDSGRLRCSAPKDALTDDLRAELASHKDELLEFLSEIRASSDANERIEPSKSGTPPPLSGPQRQIWLVQKLGLAAEAYNTAVPILIRGSIRPRLWERSLEQIVQRHEVLRSVILEDSSGPVQLVEAPARAPLLTVDLRSLPSSRRHSEAQKLLRRESVTRFDLRNGPLFRRALLWRENCVAHLSLTFHHSIADAWTLGNFAAEVTAIYPALAEGRTPVLDPLPIQYGDFARWERQWSESDAAERQLDYWRRQLADCPPPLELPTDRPRPEVPTTSGASLAFIVPRRLEEDLRALAKCEGVSFFMLLLAGFKVLLHHYTGKTDIVVGSAAANRNRPEVERLIGCFINLVALRSQVLSNLTFREFLARVRDTALGTYENQAVSFERVIEALRPERRDRHQPFFRIMVLLQNTPMPKLTMPNVEVVPQWIDPGTSPLELELSLLNGNYELAGAGPAPDDDSRTLLGMLNYNTDLFDQTTIETMLTRFEALLEDIASEPNHLVSKLLLTLPEEKRNLPTKGTTAQAMASSDPRSQMPQQGSLAGSNTEQLVSAIWASVLDISDTGANDNFFELGGHSLAAMRTISRLRETLGSQLDFQRLFAVPTIRAMAQVIDQMPSQAIAPAIKSQPRHRDFDRPQTHPDAS